MRKSASQAHRCASSKYGPTVLWLGVALACSACSLSTARWTRQYDFVTLSGATLQQATVTLNQPGSDVNMLIAPLLQAAEGIAQVCYACVDSISFSIKFGRRVIGCLLRLVDSPGERKRSSRARRTAVP